MENKEKILEIEVEVEHGVVVTKKISAPNLQFTMASEIAFNILRELNGNNMGVYLTLLKHRNMKNNKCYPSIKKISEETKLSEKTIKRILTNLHKSGYIIINSGYKGTNSNYYFPKEWFYSYFEKDINQRKAQRRKGVISEVRETKIQKENRELKEKVRKYERILTKKERENYFVDNSNEDIF